jgi:hypothetical protein
MISIHRLTSMMSWGICLCKRNRRRRSCRCMSYMRSLMSLGLESIICSWGFVIGRVCTESSMRSRGQGRICNRQMSREAANTERYKSYIRYYWHYMSSKAFGMPNILYSVNFCKAAHSLAHSFAQTNNLNYWHITNIPWHYKSYT